ncbi:MAG: putative LPS assembly protein LptD [Bacteroidetes bacterium]|nr:putative LPS assembly protein LptD [Bacteroidota bacterium]
MLTIRSYLFISLLLILEFGFPSLLYSQEVISNSKTDTTNKPPTNFNLSYSDSLNKPNDSLPIKKNTPDTLKKKTSGAILTKIAYKSEDSLRFNVVEKKVYLYNKADINYEKINLKANYIDMNFNKNEVYAKGVEDSLGDLKGTPIFKEEDKAFDSKELLYNFKSKKGLIKQVITKESEGYVHGEKVKKMANNETFIQNGRFTTCDLEHPHFDIRFRRAKVIPDKKILTGPAFLYIEDIPTPIFVPVGYFPNSKNKSSGILFPTYGESPTRGFFFENGGYYFAISDYFDLALRGDIYTRGSWGIHTLSNYNKRYKFNGALSFDYVENVEGEKNTAGYAKNTDFSFSWRYNQDAKARPNSRFSANVNLRSNKYDHYSKNLNNVFTNTTNSSISYSTTFGENSALNVNLGQSYNTNTRMIDLNLPTIAFSANRFTPFSKKIQSGNVKWYENISLSYSMEAQNRITAPDSALFTKKTLDNMQNGIRHSIPISSSIRVLKYFTLTNSININERWYSKTVKKEWSNDTLFSGKDTTVGYLKVTENKGFARAVDFQFSSSLYTKIYGMVQMSKGPLRAVRHVISPSISFSWRPDFGTALWGYYNSYKDKNGNQIKYSKFDGALYGSPESGRYGSIGLGIDNSLEIKVRSKKDTITGTKKLVLIESFSINTSYNLAADSLNLAPISMNGRTTLFKNVTLNYSSIWDPYVKQSNNNRINSYEWDVNRRIARLDYLDWRIGMNLNLNPSFFKKTNETPAVTQTQKPEYATNSVTNINQNLGEQVDFSIPWNLNLSYSYSYSSRYDASSYVKYINDYTQTLNLSGDINLTKKWKFGFSGGYDFKANDITYASIDIYRDLHCWEMRFNWIPFGFWQSWSFTINVKATVLKDLKWDKKKDFRDNANFTY